MLALSHRVQTIKASPTLAVAARANRLKAEGRDIISLGTGEPDFDTPQHIKDAAIEAIRSGFTKYTAVGGTPSLKLAVINKFKRDNHLDYSMAQVLVSCGGIRVNGNLQVVGKDDVPIPGLYAVGMEASGLYGDTYNLDVPGTANGFAHASGRVAGRHVVSVLKGAAV